MNTKPRIVAMMGEPGAGKSSVMKRLLDTFMPHSVQMFTQFPLVPYHQCGNKYVLGKYEPGVLFCGTDTMSMAVQPKAVEFLKTLEPDSVVFFEGDRLCNQSFLEHCMENYDLEIVYLVTSKAIREARFVERGSNQSEQFIASRDTKLRNLRNNFALQSVTTELRNEYPGDMDKLMEFFSTFFKD